MQRRWISGIGLALWLMVWLTIFSQSAHHVDQWAERLDDPLAPPPLAKLPTYLIDLITLGHRPVYDDFANIWLLQILTSAEVSTYPADRLLDTVTTVTSHHPKIESIYYFSCFIFAIDLNRPEYCQHVSLHGQQAFPKSWRIPMTQGYIHMYKLEEPMKAAVWFQVAASHPTSPPYVERLANKLLAQKPLTAAELQQGFRLLGKIPGGHRFESFLQSQGKNHDQTQ